MFSFRRFTLGSAALVLVDVWYDLYVFEFVERARRITTEKIAPLARAFRAAKAAVIHAPSPQVAAKYPAFLADMSEQAIRGNPQPAHDWPPPQFIAKTGPYAGLARPEHQSPTKRFNDIIENWRIAPQVEPQAGDLVIRTGEELHRLLAQRRILWLFYAGFAANICMLNRDYGMKAMAARGFEIILIRDATTGIEAAHTSATMGQTQAAITTAETHIGYSIPSAQLLAAFNMARSPAP
jgi:nicotinamidase-related amidase